MSDDTQDTRNDATITISKESIEAAVTHTRKDWSVAAVVKRLWRGRGVDAAVTVTKKW